MNKKIRKTIDSIVESKKFEQVMAGTVATLGVGSGLFGMSYTIYSFSQGEFSDGFFTLCISSYPLKIGLENIYDFMRLYNQKTN